MSCILYDRSAIIHLNQTALNTLLNNLKVVRGGNGVGLGAGVYKTLQIKKRKTKIIIYLNLCFIRNIDSEKNKQKTM